MLKEIRNNTCSVNKNLMFLYSVYAKHWIIKLDLNMRSTLFLLALFGSSMAKNLLAAEMLISTNISSEVKASTQQLVCYDLNNGGGSSYKFTEYASNLGESFYWTLFKRDFIVLPPPLSNNFLF